MDFNSLPKDLQDKLKKWDSESPQNLQISALKDIATVVEEIFIELNNQADKTSENTDKLGALLTDMRTSLASLDSKETPESPDYAKPVVAGLAKLEKALTACLNDMEMAPQVNVAAPNVQVDAPDLSGIQKALSVMPKAFQDAIKLIPEDVDIDYTDQFTAILDQLKSIDTASRMKPMFPVSQLNSINSGIAALNQNKTLATRIFPDGTTTYIAKAPVGTDAATEGWQIKKIAVSGSNTYITWAFGTANYINAATSLATVSALTYS